MVDIHRLFWEDANEQHIARHSVSREEVEEACHGDCLAAQAYGGRIMIIGPTQSGRILAIVLAPRGRGVFYPVTARPASRKEQRLYLAHERGPNVEGS